jgi:D-glycero-D-manno-heptose 1,7-bisphosphate phosphatase
MTGRVAALLLAGTAAFGPDETAHPYLLPIGGRPLLDYWVDCLAEARIAEARVDAHGRAGRLRDDIDRVNAEGRVRLVEASGMGPAGPVNRVAANADLADSAEQVVIIPAAGLSDLDLRPLIAFHRRHGGPLTAVAYRSGAAAGTGPLVVDAAAYREMAAMRAADLEADVLPRRADGMRSWTWGGYHREIATLDDLRHAGREAAAVFPPRHGPGRATPRPAIFLDRDDTLIEDVPYLSDPAALRFLPGAVDALVRLRRAGFARVLATNQSGIGRGLFTEDQLKEIHDELELRLAARGASLDAIYYCPTAPDDGAGPQCPDRKPAPGMLLRAAADLGLDLGASWMVGDKMSDVLAGLNAGCRSILLRTGRADEAKPDDPAAAGRFLVAPDLAAAVDLILTDRGAYT